MRDAAELKTLDGFKYIASVPEGEIIRAMVVKDNLYVATDKHIYKLIADKRLVKEK
ncbi:unnamed protein product [marine sediment metagenome]|uniref:Uncharacterized protein n=1 Tax=marine sediment metagenome TaxID=412755 RepID=X0WWR4_9ZZZZ